MDGLDIPIVNMFDTSFLERDEHESQPPRITTAADATSAVKYPYEPHRATLDARAASEKPDPRHGHKLQYLNPQTGASPLPTIGAFLQLLPQGFAGTPYRSTDATVFCVAEGHGESTIGERTFSWGPRDIFVVPSWHPVSHRAAEESVLFSFSDRPAQKALGIWREDS
jgi:gentisate 1,2-dioxygenase